MTFQPFEGLLRANFKGKPGEDKVINGHYLVFDERREGALIPKEQWTRSINQGARVSMSMIMSHLKRIEGQCPRSSCTGTEFRRSEKVDKLTW